MSKKVIVTGATGQDGSYMVEYLLENTENTVIAGIRRTSQAILSNLKNIIDNPRFKLVTVDLCDVHSITRLISEEKPDYFINLGAATYVADSWINPALHIQTNAVSLIHILEAVKNFIPNCRVYSAGSSEQWGDVKYSPQDEKHPMSPRSVYGVSKCAASHICKVYRESFNLFVVHGISTNHESPRRQDYFVTRKITKGVANIAHKLKMFTKGVEGISPKELFWNPIELGNIYAKRDWGHAKDFVEGIWMMLNQSKNIKEYVLSSNETHSVKEFVELAFKEVNIEGYWEGEGIKERFLLNNYLQEQIGAVAPPLVTINPNFYRPIDVEILQGCSDLIRQELGWKPKYSFKNLVREMVISDVENFS